VKASVMKATWIGNLKLGFVSVPVRVFSATEPSSTIRFNQLHDECGTRLQSRKWCPICDREIDKDEVVKGFEHDRGQYVVVTQDEIDLAKPESSRSIVLTSVIDDDEINPMYVEKPFFVAPEPGIEASAFAVVRAALGDRVAVGKMTTHGKEHTVALKAHGQGLSLFTIRRSSEVRDSYLLDSLCDLPSAGVLHDEVELARQVLAGLDEPVDLTSTRDAYQEQLREIIDAKVSGVSIVPVEQKVEDEPAQDLMAALRASLVGSSDGKEVTQ
jgi:DNA end-binding protein Ku